MKQSVVRHPKTVDPLRAATTRGVDDIVYLVGENLHGNRGCSYWPKTSRSLFALMPPNKNSHRPARKTVKVNLVGEDIDEHSVLNNAPPDGIGFFNINSLSSDYVHESGVPFNIANCIDLGTYAPLSTTDRKEIHRYEIKSFIFDHHPQEWSFGVEEKIHGVPQILDITDDYTGEPHSNARSQVPMYVNEGKFAGHLLALFCWNQLTFCF